MHSWRLPSSNRYENTDVCYSSLYTPKSRAKEAKFRGLPAWHFWNKSGTLLPIHLLHKEFADAMQIDVQMGFCWQNQAIAMCPVNNGNMAILHSGSSARKGVEVQILSSALDKQRVFIKTMEPLFLFQRQQVTKQVTLWVSIGFASLVQARHWVISLTVQILHMEIRKCCSVC